VTSTTSTTTATPATTAGAAGGGTPAGGTPASQRGTTTVAGAVVAKVASGAVRAVPGVHAVGGAGARAAGAVRGRLTGSPGASTQGVSVAVDSESAAVAVELVAEHGSSLPAVAQEVRRSVAEAVQSLVGLRVTAVDVLVTDVHVPSDDTPAEPAPLPPTRTTAR
jgi:uncharacterized alkaline shock family protein YloU